MGNTSYTMKREPSLPLKQERDRILGIYLCLERNPCSAPDLLPFLQSNPRELDPTNTTHTSYALKVTL